MLNPFKPNYRKIFLSVFNAFLFPLLLSAATPKNIILFIGDGMAANQRLLAEAVNQKQLTMNSLPVVGMYTTHSRDSLITDSAAAGTAMATGHKTNYGVISMNPTGEISFETLAEAAKRLGKSVGILTTTRITDATPASFGSHVRRRGAEMEIAAQYLNKEFEVWMGGGLSYFIPKSQNGGKRRDRRNLLEEFMQKGYTFINNRKQLKSLQINKDAKILGLFGNSHLPYYLDRRPDSIPDLSEMTMVAISVLSQNPKGFFLMVEGGRIDHACHGNSPAALVAEVLELDNAVAVAVEFSKRYNDTLVLVGADHETGGMGLGRDGELTMNPSILKNISASEPGMAAYLENSPEEALEHFKKATGIAVLELGEENLIIKAIKKHGDYDDEGRPIYHTLNWFHWIFGSILSTRAGIGWTTTGHTGHPVVMTAMGPGSETFSGYYDNTDVGTRIGALWGIDFRSWRKE